MLEIVIIFLKSKVFNISNIFSIFIHFFLFNNFQDLHCGSNLYRSSTSCIEKIMIYWIRNLSSSDNCSKRKTISNTFSTSYNIRFNTKTLITHKMWSKSSKSCLNLVTYHKSATFFNNLIHYRNISFWKSINATNTLYTL